MPQIMELLQASHRRQLHMGQSHAFNAQFPVDTLQSLRLHYFTVLFQHFVVNTVALVFLHF